MNRPAGWVASLIVGGPLVALGLGVLALRGRPPQAPPPVAAGALKGANVLLVTVDGLRPDHLGAYSRDGALTPTLDRFAKDGIYLARAYSHVPVSRPSVRTILSGVYPDRADAPAALAARLAAVGYRTGAFVGSRDLAAGRDGLATGFDRYDDLLPDNEASRSAEEVFAAALAWAAAPAPSDRPPAPVAQSPGSRSEPPAPAVQVPAPWFLWVHLSDPNPPYQPPASFAARSDLEGYDGEIAYVDSALLGFLTGLRRTGVFGRTLVTIASTYGDALGEHGEASHGSLAYDATLRVPVILWAPPQLGAGLVAPTTRLIDLAPTIVDLVAAAPIDGADGRSILPLLGPSAAGDRESYFEVNGMRGVVKGGRKLIAGRTPELYDLEADPEERHNQYRPGSAEERELEDLLDRIAGR
ncbi:MAG: sulfatase [Acidobacteria bacterium]|nr:sulfatase [Acidobacteriota bacterium]